LLVSLPGPDHLFAKPALPRLEVGAEVRLCAGPRCGRWGRVAALRLSPTRVAGNITCPTAEVVLDDGVTETVSLANLEMVG